jgi:hypothetical protein
MMGPTKAKNERKGPTKEKKIRKKGPTKVKMKGIDPLNYFCSADFKNVPRANESLNPALRILPAPVLN